MYHRSEKPETATDWGAEMLRYGLIMLGLGIAVAVGIRLAKSGM